MLISEGRHTEMLLGEKDSGLMNRSGGINEQEAGVRHCRMQDIQSYFPNNLSFFPPSFSLAVFIWDICSLVLFLNTYQHSFRGPVTA